MALIDQPHLTVMEYKDKYHVGRKYFIKFKDVALHGSYEEAGQW
jgi:hypothetical protein